MGRLVDRAPRGVDVPQPAHTRAQLVALPRDAVALEGEMLVIGAPNSSNSLRLAEEIQAAAGKLEEADEALTSARVLPVSA